jgi:hypothetical protein
VGVPVRARSLKENKSKKGIVTLPLASQAAQRKRKTRSCSGRWLRKQRKQGGIFIKRKISGVAG